MTEKEKLEVLNLRKRLVAQREEIKRLQELVKHYEKERMEKEDRRVV